MPVLTALSGRSARCLATFIPVRRITGWNWKRFGIAIGCSWDMTAKFLTAGDYFTVQIGEYPLIIVRDRDGEIRAFHNTCRHRGSRICSAERGTVPRFVCPYHQWTYKLSGDLIAARDTGGDFQRAQYNLKAAHCAHVGGYIFVCLSAAAAGF